MGDRRGRPQGVRRGEGLRAKKRQRTRPRTDRPRRCYPRWKARPVIFAAHRADDIRTALRIADEFGLKPIIALGTEAFLLADELAKRKVPVIVHPTMQRPGDSMETVNTLMENAAILQKAAWSRDRTSSRATFRRPQPPLRGSDGRGQRPRPRRGDEGDHRSTPRSCSASTRTTAASKSARWPTSSCTTATRSSTRRTSPKRSSAARSLFDRDEYLALPFERRALPMLGTGAGGVGCCLGW